MDMLKDYISEFESNKQLVTMTAICIRRLPKYQSEVCYDLFRRREYLAHNRDASEEEIMEYIKGLILETDLEEFRKMYRAGKKTLKLIERIKDSLGGVECEMGAYI